MATATRNKIKLAKEQCFLHYHMVIDNLYNSNGNIIGESFGVEVALCNTVGRIVEYKKIHDITVFSSNAMDLLLLLAQGQVTPYVLDEVVSEYLAAH